MDKKLVVVTITGGKNPCFYLSHKGNGWEKVGENSIKVGRNSHQGDCPPNWQSVTSPIFPKIIWHNLWL